MSLLILNSNKEEPQDYTLRKTVKAVVVNEDSKVLLLSTNLIGGGLEEGETDQQALFREALEEAGMQIEILSSIGEVIQYRDSLKKKYVIQGYYCRYIATVTVPDLHPEEKEVKASWFTAGDAMNFIESEIQMLKNSDPLLYEGDTYQSKLYNRETSLIFLKHVFQK